MFIPKRVFFEQDALAYPLGRELQKRFKGDKIPVSIITSHNRFRFVTKFTGVDGLLNASHNGHTRFRFSINTEHIIRSYEGGTPASAARLRAARRVAEAGYPLGFLIAPIFVYPGWQDDYTGLIRNLAGELKDHPAENVTFELISHRFTLSAKKRIMEIYPDTTLPMDESERKFKFGQFGYGKYVYPKETLQEMDELFRRKLDKHFPGAKVEYLV